MTDIPRETEERHLRLVEITMDSPELAPVVAAAPSQAAPARAEPATKTILLVEDEDTIRTIASRLLGRAGFRVLTAAKPSEAFSLFDQHRSEIDLLLTDIVMPEMSGLSLAEQLRGISPELPVLFMSGYADVNGTEIGGRSSAFISKPFTAAALISAVNDVLSRRQ